VSNRSGTVQEEAIALPRPEIYPAGILLAAMFFSASLTPSLIPRDPLLQGVLGGAVGAIGFEIGRALRWLWTFMELPKAGPGWQRRMRLTGFGVAAAIAAFGLYRAADWQNATRAVFGMEPVESSHVFTVGGVALAVFVVLWLVFRLFGILNRLVIRQLNRVLPPRVGMVIGFGLALWLFWALVDGVLVRQAFRIADASFEAADTFIPPDQPAPTEPMRSGSAESLLDWHELGRWGRSFVATVPTREEIAEFVPEGAMEPVRVYVGRRSAETSRERAELALQELIRAGGFERSAVIVTSPVGTGWMDPGAHDTVDFMLGGDVATVAVQYSYLTSVLALLAHPDYGVEQTRELFDVVYDYWTGLPRETRPRLYVHGLSQGAFNSQRTLPLLDMLADPIHGAMWAGSPFFSPFWQSVRDRRNPGSPAWRPQFGNGSLVRTVTQYGGLDRDYAPWGPIRIVFLNYGSDPIVVFNSGSGLLPPAWLEAPRAPDVAPELRWFPLVTMFQLGLDSAISLKEPGFGHFYIARDYIDAWAPVVDPDGWSPARSEELKAIFERRGLPR
jgi:uncharacterized membrane protein